MLSLCLMVQSNGRSCRFIPFAFVLSLLEHISHLETSSLTNVLMCQLLNESKELKI